MSTTTAEPVGSGLDSGSGPWLLLDSANLAKRNLVHIMRRPDQLMAALLQPIMFFVLFTFVFGGAILQSTDHYKQFVLAGVFGQIVVFGGVASMCVGIAEDLRNGMIDRFRSLPMSSAAVLLGRTTSEAIRNLVAFVVTGAVAVAFGFRIHGNVGQVLLGMLLLLFFGYAVCWVISIIGIKATSVESAQTMVLPWLFLLGFVSSAFVPTSAMPGWIQVFANHTPVTLTINSARDLFNGQNPGSAAWQSAIWSAALLVVFIPVASRAYRTALVAS